MSLDALRGFDMFWIMSGEQIIHALAKVTSGVNRLAGCIHCYQYNYCSVTVVMVSVPK